MLVLFSLKNPYGIQYLVDSLVSLIEGEIYGAAMITQGNATISLSVRSDQTLEEIFLEFIKTHRIAN